MASNNESTGAELVARCIKALGITTVFGLTGFPITSVLEQLIDHGVKYVGFRNEQAASYAATAYGYLTGKPGCCFVVGGPGVVHALAGVVNSTSNCFPMLLLAGSSDSRTVGRGGFQELDAVSMLTPHVNVALRPQGLETVPFSIRDAYRLAWYLPATGFVDLPADILQAKYPIDKVPLPRLVQSPSVPYPDEAKVWKIAEALKAAAAPLVVIGKGCAYARAENQLRGLIDITQIPFLPTPMGKGVVPDSHPCNISAARSLALRHTDVVLVLGAKLNWILHFGVSPKWAANVRIAQVDVDLKVIGQNAGDAELGVNSDINAFLNKLLPHLHDWEYAENTPYRNLLAKEIAKNAKVTATAGRIDSVPLKFERAYQIIRDTLDSFSPPSNGGIVYISEGARTMDTSRQWFYQEHPRLRLDAGTNGTMGIGFAYAIAAWEAYNGPHAEASSGKPGRKKVVGLIGDSATGFSGMEIETMARMGMDCLIFVMNNSGVYHGSADSEEEYLAQHQATKSGRGADGHRSWSLGFQTRYDYFAEAVGGKGYLVRTSEELRKAAEEGFMADVPVIVNVLVESGKGFPAVFGFEVSAKTETAGTKGTKAKSAESKL